ncbi:uncharacterized protein LOC134279556 isoform X1 [Saccostrea cucullata]|uniref:uncharacterized protein LOC134279556 isoform X1 n=1 Tax=Saccostrea cuccullata TaxID=36930 RepID=UPI002ED2884A
MAEINSSIIIDEEKKNSNIKDVIAEREKELSNDDRFRFKNATLYVTWELKKTDSNKMDIPGNVEEFCDHIDTSPNIKTELRKDVDSEKEPDNDFEMVEPTNNSQSLEKGFLTNLRDTYSKKEEPKRNFYQIWLDNKWKEFVVLHPRYGNLCEKIFNEIIQGFPVEDRVYYKITENTKEELPTLILCLCISRVDDDITKTLSLVDKLPPRAMLVGLECCEEGVKPNKRINTKQEIHGIRVITNILYSRVRKYCYKCDENISAIEQIKDYLKEF